jgi:hypothetical protein
MIRRARITLAASLLALAVGGAGQAHAGVSLAGAWFSSGVSCSSAADGLEVTSVSNARDGSFAMIYLLDTRTGLWIHENQWHGVANYPVTIHGSFSFAGHAYYKIYMHYAQATSAGWRYSGEYITTYSQRNANGYEAYASSTCYI